LPRTSHSRRSAPTARNSYGAFELTSADGEANALQSLGLKLATTVCPEAYLPKYRWPQAMQSVHYQLHFRFTKTGACLASKGTSAQFVRRSCTSNATQKSP
jgi:hypothetical protein